MNKTAVVYQSKYGSTQKYAKWISQELSCDLYEKSSIKIADLMGYDTIIYGGGLYAGGVSGIDLITKNFDCLKEKRLILFTCGLADPHNPENIAHIKEGLAKTLSPEMQKKIVVYHLRGGIDYARLGLIHKSMMAMLHSVLAKKDSSALSQEDKQMLDTYGKAVDFTDKAAIKPIVEFVRA